MKRLFNILLFVALLYSQFAKAQELLIESYNTHDGLIQSSVADIIQDKYGMMWLFTEKGISAFDGIEFYNYIDSVEFFDSWLVSACADTSGNYYLLNFNNQVWRWNKRTFEQIQLPPGISVLAINISGQNDLIIGTRNSGVLIFHNDEWIKITNEMGLYSNTVTAIAVINNITFVATSRGLNKLIKDKPVRLFPYDNLNVHSLLLDSQNRYWLGAVNGLYVYKDNNLNRVDSAPVLIEDLCEDNRNNIWIATRTGLYKIADNEKNLNAIPVIAESDFQSLLINREGIVWAGTIGKGVFTIKHNLFKSIKQKSGFSLRSPFPIHEDTDGKVWIGTDHGLVTFSNSNWQVIEELKGKIVINLFEDDRGDLWIINPAEIYRYSSGRLELAIDYKALPASKRFVSQLKDGTIIIGTSNDGLWEFAGNTVVKSELNEKLKGEILYTSYKDSCGNVWIGTNNGGIIKIADHEVIKFDSTKGITAESIFQFSEDKDGNIWAASSNGVYVINNDSVIKSYSTSQGLTSNTCYSVITNNKTAFIGTSDGLNLIDGESVESFTTADGLLNNDCNTNSFMIDKKGNLWIGTTDGISKINLTDQKMTKSNIGCLITKLKSGEREIDLLTSLNKENSKQFIFDPGENDLIFTCAGLYYSQPSSVSYTFTLKSESENLTHSTRDNVYEVKNLKPGEYELYAYAKSPAGKPVRSVNTISFIIKPFFYQTSGFYIFLLSAALSAGIFFIFIRTLNKKKKLADKYKTSSLTAENYENVKLKIITAIETDKIYRDAELTLPKLAAVLQIHKEYISQVINNEYKKNFNEFINTYRIEEAKSLLCKNDNIKINILNIAHEVGFNSKTTFNITFKKLTGLTPTEFKYSKQ